MCGGVIKQITVQPPEQYTILKTLLLPEKRRHRIRAIFNYKVSTYFITSTLFTYYRLIFFWVF